MEASLRLPGRFRNRCDRLHGRNVIEDKAWRARAGDEPFMSMTVTIYGLAACDTTRAARKWLNAQGVVHAFHDVREDGLTRSLVERWVRQLVWESLLNRVSTTWRELPPEAKEDLDQRAAVTLLLTHPTLVKRPVLDRGGSLSVGFKPAAYALLFG